MAKRDEAEWYAGGLRFECRPDCGACCTNHGDYSYVYLEGDDDLRLAAHLGLSLGEFRRRHTERDEGDLVLRMNEPACPFLDGPRCTVYEARPTQCRTFPFWSENLTTPRAWKRTARFCPGIDRGPLHALPVIRARIADRDGGET